MAVLCTHRFCAGGTFVGVVPRHVVHVALSDVSPRWNHGKSRTRDYVPTNQYALRLHETRRVACSCMHSKLTGARVGHAQAKPLEKYSLLMAPRARAEETNT